MKRKNPLYKLLIRIAKKFSDVKFIITCPLEEAPVIVTNHTKISAPAMFLTHYPNELRTWSHASFLNIRSAWKHLKNNVLKREKSKILYPIAFLFLPVIVWFFRSINPIPVYKESMKLVDTFDESVITKENLTTQIIFPEKLDKDIAKSNDYIFKLNRGFVYILKYYYEKTGKILKFYPAYSCTSLKTVIIGEPIAYNPDIPFREMREIVCDYIETKIQALALMLPPHKIILPVQD